MRPEMFNEGPRLVFRAIPCGHAIHAAAAGEPVRSPKARSGLHKHVEPPSQDVHARPEMSISPALRMLNCSALNLHARGFDHASSRNVEVKRTARPAAIFACLSGMALGPLAASADEAPNLLTNPFHIAIGTFAISSEPTIELNGETTSGDKVNFDEVLGGGDASACGWTPTGGSATASATRCV